MSAHLLAAVKLAHRVVSLFTQLLHLLHQVSQIGEFTHVVGEHMFLHTVEHPLLDVPKNTGTPRLEPFTGPYLFVYCA